MFRQRVAMDRFRARKNLARVVNLPWVRAVAVAVVVVAEAVVAAVAAAVLVVIEEFW